MAISSASLRSERRFATLRSICRRFCMRPADSVGLSQKPGISICRSMSFSWSSTPASSKIPPDRGELFAQAAEALLQFGGEHVEAQNIKRRSRRRTSGAAPAERTPCRGTVYRRGRRPNATARSAAQSAGTTQGARANGVRSERPSNRAGRSPLSPTPSSPRTEPSGATTAETPVIAARSSQRRFSAARKARRPQMLPGRRGVAVPGVVGHAHEDGRAGAGELGDLVRKDDLVADRRAETFALPVEQLESGPRERNLRRSSPGSR